MYFTAFNAVRDDRQYGDSGGAGRISFIAIECWARLHQMNVGDFFIFHTLMREMDEEYIVWLNEEAKKAADKAGNKDT